MSGQKTKHPKQAHNSGIIKTVILGLAVGTFSVALYFTPPPIKNLNLVEECLVPFNGYAGSNPQAELVEPCLTRLESLTIYNPGQVEEIETLEFELIRTSTGVAGGDAQGQSQALSTFYSELDRFVLTHQRYPELLAVGSFDLLVSLACTYVLIRDAFPRPERTQRIGHPAR